MANTLPQTTKTNPEKNKRISGQPSPAERYSSGSSSGIDPIFVHGEAGWNGDFKFKYNDPRSPETGAEEHFDLTGSYTIKENNNGDIPMVNKITIGHENHYISGGHTHTVDGNKDTRTGDAGNLLDNVFGAMGASVAKDVMKGIGATVHKVTGGSGSFHHDAGGDHNHATSGNHTSIHDGNKTEKTTGDHVKVVTGNHVQHTTGDHYNYNDSGNYSIKVNSGNYSADIASNISILSESGSITVNSNSQNVVVTAATSITLKCGSSSIIITPSSITMISDKINLNP